ncbi:MAG: glycoside hydrolase [Treponema sp.]|jgi:hypothetical protein|nr:glycoside hydrolase [Treponema sp.]
MNLHSHTRSVADKCRDIWISPDRFTKNPDIVQTREGRLLLVYSDNDQHWSQVNQILTILASDDEGQNWYKFSEAAQADLAKGDERLVTPRLSCLSDGRLAVLVDHDDYSHFHEEQSFGNWIYWSEDGGRTWSPPQKTRIPGFEPDRIMELPDGRLAVVSHVLRAKSMEFAVIISLSEDRGGTWKEYATVAHDGYHRFCEGAMILLEKEWAVIMRENHCAGFPNFVCFSRDEGRNWTAPQMLPFHFHRPYGKLLPGGRVLVTGRNLLGGVGTYAWAGDLRAEAGYYEAGGPMAEYKADFEDGALVIENGPELDCRYTLLPPENAKSELIFEAELKAEGPDDKAVAFLSVNGLSLMGAEQALLRIAPNWIMLNDRGADFAKKADMRRYRHVRLCSRRGLLTVDVDGEVLINQCVFHEGCAYGDFYSPVPGKRTQFGQIGDEGRSFWKTVHCRELNPALPDYDFYWAASGGKYPDAYQRERLTLIHANVHPRLKAWPDHGYSSWLVLGDGSIVFVDYTNLGDKPGKSHLVGARFRPEDL